MVSPNGATRAPVIAIRCCGMSPPEQVDVAVIGAGVFGAWCAWHLGARGERVLLLDSYGPGHSRASSGGETRIIRMGYGEDEIYTRWSERSLAEWKKLFSRIQQPLFLQTGVLWLAGRDSSRLEATERVLARCGVPRETLGIHELRRRFPQVDFADITQGILEPESGVLMARRAVAAVVEDALGRGTRYLHAHVLAPSGPRQLSFVATARGQKIQAKEFVFACGPWLGKTFPDLLGSRIFPTRQEVFFFATPPGDSRFSAPALPTWLFQEDLFYGMPDIESRGLKIAYDGHGESIDPDNQSRIVTQHMTQKMRDYVGRRFPALKDAPITESRVCQYENSSNGDFLVDRHPDFDNVWLVGGGSGHGFKHGPALGEYLSGQILDQRPAEPRFSLATKATMQRREVF
jgi:sarcosine oxidase